MRANRKIAFISFVLVFFVAAKALAGDSFGINNSSQGATSAGTGSAFDLLEPQRHQIDIEMDDAYQFLTPDSSTKRRINSQRAARIHLIGDLGNSTMQLPAIQITYWFDSENAAQIQSRYFAMYGGHGVSYPLGFGGATLAPNQVLSTAGTRAFAIAAYYERRLTPLYENAQTELPRWLQGWDTRAKIGLEFSYFDFRINNGSPTFTGFSQFMARTQFQEKNLPVPAIGLEARRWIAEKLALEITAQGNWINKWNSWRDEGGPVYDSQSGFETHWRLIYSDPHWHGFSPYGGLNYYYYKNQQSSSGVENFIKLQMIGPEFGFNYSI